MKVKFKFKFSEFVSEATERRVSGLIKHEFKRIRFYLSWLGLLVYFRRGSRARVVMTDESGRILLVRGLWMRWYDDNGLALPGGALETGEAPAEAASRELWEELGITVPAKDLKPLATGRIREYGISYKVHLLTVASPAMTIFNLQEEEIVYAEWHDPKKLKGIRLKPDVKWALKLLAGKS